MTTKTPITSLSFLKLIYFFNVDITVWFVVVVFFFLFKARNMAAYREELVYSSRFSVAKLTGFPSHLGIMLHKRQPVTLILAKKKRCRIILTLFSM